MNILTIDLAIVTGAGRGIGRAMARSIAALGVPVLAISRTANCRIVVDEVVANGGKGVALPLDLADFGDTKRQVTAFLAEHPATRIAIIAAAATLGPQGPLWETNLAEWEPVLRANLLGNLAVIQAALPAIRASSFGRIIMFAGGGSGYAYPVFPAYAASKTAVVRAIENIGVEMKDLADFAAVVVAPGAVNTDMQEIIRGAGAEVRTPTSVNESIGFVTAFIRSPHAKRLSGRFIHVRDEWAPVLEGAAQPGDAHWKLRRVE